MNAITTRRSILTGFASAALLGLTTRGSLALDRFGSTGFENLHSRDDGRNFKTSHPAAPSTISSQAIEISSTKSAGSLDLTNYHDVSVVRWLPTSPLAQAWYTRVDREPRHQMKFRDANSNWFEIAEPEINVICAGAVPGHSDVYSANNTEAIQRALDVGRSVLIPPGLYSVGTIHVRWPGQVIENYGTLQWNGNGSDYAFPLLILEACAVGAEFRNLGIVDHRGTLWRSAAALPAVSNRAMESCVLLMADNCRFVGGGVKNAFDNGIAIINADLYTGVQKPGYPKFVRVLDVMTENCGVGLRTHDSLIGPHQAGSGINLLTGSFVLIRGCVDSGSRTNFIADYGGGASGIFESCIGNGAALSATGRVSFDGEEQMPGGMGVYCGSQNVRWSNIQISDPQSWGGWWDAYSARNDIEMSVKGARQGGILLSGSYNRLTARITDCSTSSDGRYPAIRLRGGAYSGQTIEDSVHQRLLSCVTDGEMQSFGVEILDGPLGQIVAGRSDACEFRGRRGEFYKSPHATFNLNP